MSNKIYRTIGIIAMVAMLYVVTTQWAVSMLYSEDSSYCTTLKQLMALDKAGIGLSGGPALANTTTSDTIEYNISCLHQSPANVSQSDLTKMVQEQNNMIDAITPKPLN